MTAGAPSKNDVLSMSTYVLLKNEREASPEEVLALSRAVNELTTACGVALTLRTQAIDQLSSHPQEGEASTLAKTARKLTAVAITLSETASALSSYLGVIAGVPPRPDPRR